MRTSRRLKQRNNRRYQQKKKHTQSVHKIKPISAPTAPIEKSERPEKPAAARLPEKKQTGKKAHQNTPEQKTFGKPLAEQPTALPAIPSTPIRNKQNFRFILISLLLAMISGFWLMQKSINAYYQQTYHRNSPLVYLEKNPVWSLGARLEDQFSLWLTQVQDHIAALNNDVMQGFNQQYAYTPEYKAYLQQEMKKRQALAAKQTAAASQQARQNKQKADFTLNGTDEVFFAGDSLMQGVAPHVQKWLSEQYGIKSVNLSKQSTGLAYPSFFDWPKTIKETLAQNKNIKILVVYLGPNDPWDMPDPKGGDVYLKFQSPQWAEVYRQRISNIMQTAKQHHVTVLWLMPPSVRKNKLNQQLIYLRRLMTEEVTKDQAYIMDTGHIVGSDGTKYSDTLLTDNGQRVKTRSADGIHFSLEGQKIIARSVLNHFYVHQ